MKAFKNILFPIDFSECSESVFPYAIDMAQRLGAKLHLLFVARDISYLEAIDVASQVLVDTLAEVTRAGQKRMKQFCEKNLSDFPNYEAKVVGGDAADEILKFADRQGIDLIVMGTHGRKGLDRILIGSVADRVIKNAAMPVLTVNPFKPKVKYVKS
jgi:nucleotide-binding universal stress UspA family protein